MIILDIDPGTARLGYGVLRKEGSRLIHVQHGCLETPANMPQPARLYELSQQINELMALFRPTIVGVEKLFFSKNVKTAMAVSEARGMILVACQRNALEILEHTPNEVKQAVTGYGAADKKQVTEMVCKLLKLKDAPTPDDAADALAIAYCAGASYDFKRIAKGR